MDGRGQGDSLGGSVAEEYNLQYQGDSLGGGVVDACAYWFTIIYRTHTCVCVINAEVIAAGAGGKVWGVR